MSRPASSSHASSHHYVLRRQRENSLPGDRSSHDASTERYRQSLRSAMAPSSPGVTEAGWTNIYKIHTVHETEKAESASSQKSAGEEDHFSDLTYDPNIDEGAEFLDDDSPYPEVRSAVANTDDPDMPVSTIRAWTIGLLWAILIPGLNQLLFFRYPSVAVGPLIAQLLSFPVGQAWARVIPRMKILGISLNPGPFTIKEHVLVVIMAGVSAGSAYGTDIVAVQRVYYAQRYSFLYQWLVVMSTQLIGFSIGGIARRFLVSPPSMIWPSNLVYCVLFNTLHSQQYAGIGKHSGMSRERFFLIGFTLSALWYLLPGYLFTALSMFNWVCWIRPNNIAINQLFGYTSGLGMSILTFDWSQIAYIGSPLATPWWAEANITAGFVIFFWILTPALYYKNVWYAQYMPITSRGAFDNTGSPYNVTRILTPDTQLDLRKYQEYSPLFLSTTFAVSYGLSFASITATIVHAILYFRKQIYHQAKRSLKEQPDIHARLMSMYPEVPDWWYAGVFAVMFVAGAVAVELWKTQLPMWAYVMALAIAFAYVLPVGILLAITNQQVGLNVITELIVGYTLPGRPVAMMMFKTWGYITMSQALTFVSDMKLGHYMKIPPRVMFWSQIIATVIAGTTQLAVQNWMFNHIPGMCDPSQKHGFTCPNTEVFFTASIIWGVIGPQQIFSAGQTYYFLLFFFLFGALAPVIPWMITRKYPHSFFRYVNIPVLLSGVGFIPPANAVNYVPWSIVGFIFQRVIRRKYFAWWTKYNYVLSAALDSGVAVSTLVIFFTLQWPKDGQIGANVLDWWGNTVWQNTADARNTPLRPAPVVPFGPSSW